MRSRIASASVGDVPSGSFNGVPSGSTATGGAGGIGYGDEITPRVSMRAFA